MRGPHFILTRPKMGKTAQVKSSLIRIWPPVVRVRCHSRQEAEIPGKTQEEPHPICNPLYQQQQFRHSPEEFHCVGVIGRGFGFPRQDGLEVSGFPAHVVRSRIGCCKMMSHKPQTSKTQVYECMCVLTEVSH